MSRRLVRTGVAMTAIVTVLWAGGAFAQATAQDQAAARALFDQGRTLVEANKPAEACPKFEESQRLDPGIGTLFNLADCYEKVGRTASAWSMFLDVASQAAAQKRADRESAARDRANALKPRLSNLVIHVAGDPDLPGLEIKRDGTVVGKPMWGNGVPVDPGKHVVLASAPGYKTWTGSVDVPAKPGESELSVPALSKDATPGAVSVDQGQGEKPADGSNGSSRRLIGVVVGGAGVLTLGVSTVLALSAKSKFNDTSSMCNGNFCTEQGASMRHDAVRAGNVATIVGGVGIVAMAAGAVVYLTAPSGNASSAAGKERFRTVVAVGPGSVAVGGTW
ncbi:MAG: hypothetical protein HY898_19035 [Deltaproteobacteria bacterium]|nr:hypothetical protein [Deltaproteobacteria bacterium]